MPKECGSWRAFRAQARHPPPGPAHPLHYQLTQSLPPGRLLSPRPHSCCAELAHRAHTGTGLNRPCVQRVRRRHQHQVTVSSQPAEEGGCACVHIWPRRRVAALADRRDEDVERKRQKIDLIHEDISFLITLLITFLSKHFNLFSI